MKAHRAIKLGIKNRNKKSTNIDYFDDCSDVKGGYCVCGGDDGCDCGSYRWDDGDDEYENYQDE